MEIKFVRLNFQWDEKMPISYMRAKVLDKLKNEGEPLRWAISDVKPLKKSCLRELTIDAVVTIH